MESNTTAKANNIFTKLYRTRCVVSKGDTTILNLSALFTVIAVLTAPWVALAFVICGLVLGYRFHIRKNDPSFGETLDTVVHSVKANVQNVTKSFTDDNE